MAFGCGSVGNEFLVMKVLRQFGYALASLLIVCALAFPVVAQKGGKSAPPPPPPPQNNKNNQGQNQGQNQQRNPPNNQNARPNNQNNQDNKPANPRETAKLPPKFVEKLQDMSPEQQERF